MSAKEQRRQKKLAKKRSKELSKRKDQARERSMLNSRSGQLQAAASGPIDRCMLSELLLQESSTAGLGNVVISRRMRDGRITCVVFMVDMRCLGVKDLFIASRFPSEMSSLMSRLREQDVLSNCEPAKARKLVEGAIEYAAQFDIAPHPDYRIAKQIWAGVDPNECEEEFRYGGKEGKPFYFGGPNDSPVFQQEILSKLEQHAGEGNYHFSLMRAELPGGKVLMLGDDQFDDEFDEDEFVEDELDEEEFVEDDQSNDDR